LRTYSPLFGGVPGGQQNSSATFLNSRYALASAHQFTQVGIANITAIEVADGPNAQTNRGNVMAVTEVIFHPTLDLTILRFAAPFRASADKVIGSAVTGDITISAGFGSWGTPSTGTTRDYNLRAWDARVHYYNFGYSDYYQSTTFGYGNTSGLSLRGRLKSRFRLSVRA
jgi:hypothetical protein